MRREFRGMGAEGAQPWSWTSWVQMGPTPLWTIPAQGGSYQ